MTQNDIDVEKLFDKHIHRYYGEVMTLNEFKSALTEALAGRWKDEDVEKVLIEHSWHSAFVVKSIIAQFKEDRNITFPKIGK